MSANEFWEGNPDLFWAYRFSYFNKMKEDRDAMNYQLWLQGAYFHEAVSVALANSFGKRKISYTSKPYNLTEEDKKRDIEIQQKELETRIRNRISEMQKIKGKE